MALKESNKNRKKKVSITEAKVELHKHEVPKQTKKSNKFLYICLGIAALIALFTF